MTISMNPVLLSIGSLEIRWYGICVALAIVTVAYWTYLQAKKGAKVSQDQILTGVIIGTLCGIIGARLVHVIDEWGYYSNHMDQIIGGAGLAIYGGILGAALGLFVYSKFSNFKALYLFDVMAPGIALAQIVGRLGCLINGCCHGVACDLAWAVTYTHPNSYAESLNVPFHPVQLYEMIFLLILAIALILLKKKIRFIGSQFLMYFGCYSLFRIAVGFIRENQEVFGGLVQSQVIGIIVAVVCFSGLIYQFIKYKKNGDFDPELDAIEHPNYIIEDKAPDTDENE